MEGQIDLDGGPSRFVIKWMLPQYILQFKQVHIGAQRHLPHAVGVKVELVICDLNKVLLEIRRKQRQGIMQRSHVHMYEVGGSYGESNMR